MPTETLTTDGRTTRTSSPLGAAQDEETLRKLAVQQIERARKVKLHVYTYLLGIAVLTPIWVLTQYMDNNGWPKRLSDNSNPGDWDPWIVWVAIIWGFIVGLDALRAYYHRPTTEAEIERAIARLKQS